MRTSARRLTAATIEGRVALLRIEFEPRFERILRPPVPIDEILERYLGFHLEFDDLAAKGYVQAHGLTILDSKQVFIDSSLDPHEHPQMEGRCNFTIAHEIGHIVLHRQYPQGGFKPEDPSSVGSQQELEWQADKFASYLLMPEKLVRAETDRLHADGLIEELTPEIIAAGSENFGSEADFLLEWYQQCVEQIARPFRVSADAMRIRLEELDLLPAIPK